MKFIFSSSLVLASLLLSIGVKAQDINLNPQSLDQQSLDQQYNMAQVPLRTKRKLQGRIVIEKKHGGHVNTFRTHENRTLIKITNTEKRSKDEYYDEGTSEKKEFPVLIVKPCERDQNWENTTCNNQGQEQGQDIILERKAMKTGVSEKCNPIEEGVEVIKEHHNYTSWYDTIEDVRELVETWDSEDDYDVPPTDHKIAKKLK